MPHLNALYTARISGILTSLPDWYAADPSLDPSSISIHGQRRRFFLAAVFPILDPNGRGVRRAMPNTSICTSIAHL